MREEVDLVLAVTEDAKPTSAIDCPKPGTVTFWRGKLPCPRLGSMRLWVLTSCKQCEVAWPDRVRAIFTETPEWTFWCYHNWYWAGRSLPTRSECGLACNIHQSAVIGASGLKIVRGPENQLLKAFHSGQVVIGDRVEIGPNSVVHRAVLSATIIGNDVTIGSLCNIGHNVQIGERSILTVGVSLSGSSSIGADCFIGSGVTVLEGVRVCGKVKIGAGSVVTRDITHPGIYFGSPAKFKGDWDGRW